MRTDVVLALALAALAGAWLVTAPWVTLLGAGTSVLLLRRQLRPVLVGAMALLFCVSAFSARSVLTEFERAHRAVRVALGAPKRCAFSMRITESPVWRQDRAKLVGLANDADCDGRSLPPGTLVAVYGGNPDLRRGDRLYVIADLAPVRVFRNLGLPDPTPRAAARGVLLSGGAHAVELLERPASVAGGIDGVRAYTRRRIRATFAPGAEGLARALVLGESDLSDEEDEAFRKSGLSHLLAVSGTHLVFAVVSIVYGLRALLLRIPALAAGRDVGRLAAGAGALLALLYADFAGGSGSAWRAAWMLSAALCARALDRAPSVMRAVGWSIAVGVVVDPLAGFDLSFLLSLAATTGLLVLSRIFGVRLTQIRHAAARWLATGVSATIASMIPCAPLLALMAPEITLAGVAANVVAAPFGEVVSLPLCLLHPLLGFVPELERGVALAASGALLIVGQIAKVSADATWAAVPVPSPTPSQLAAIILVAVSWAARSHLALRAAFLGLLVLSEVWLCQFAAPRGALRVSVLDVGQGDAVLVDMPNGELWLVDGGGFVGSKVDPGKRVILPLLRARRRARVDVVVLSHPHPDHFGGLVSVLEQIEVGEFWDTGQGETHGAGPQFAQLLAVARARGVAVRRPEDVCGRRTRGGLGVRVLAPCPGFAPAREANDNSFVIQLQHGRRRVLLTGDAEAELERELVGKHGDELRADLLKVGHHGSRTSTSAEFLRRVRPSVATISCGMRNRFGHPHAPTLALLARHGAGILRTDDVGSISWRSDGEQVSVATYFQHRGWLSVDGPQPHP
jgi:competence protein ComEC